MRPSFIYVVTLIRAFLGAGLTILSTFAFSIVVLGCGFLNQQLLATRLIRFWARLLLWTFGVRLEVQGEENLPGVGGGIIAFNHQSHLDIPSIVMSTRKQIRFGAKIELFKIPFFGPAMASVGTLKIARENRSEVLKIYEEASQRFKQNILFVLAPEGTRQREPHLGKFKKGPFIFALNSKVPLIPVVIKGAFHVMPPHRLLINVGQWRRTIHVQFLKPIDSQRFSTESLETFVSEASAQMNAAFEELPGDHAKPSR